MATTKCTVTPWKLRKDRNKWLKVKLQPKPFYFVLLFEPSWENLYLFCYLHKVDYLYGGCVHNLSRCSWLKRNSGCWSCAAYRCCFRSRSGSRGTTNGCRRLSSSSWGGCVTSDTWSSGTLRTDNRGCICRYVCSSGRADGTGNGCRFLRTTSCGCSYWLHSSCWFHFP